MLTDKELAEYLEEQGVGALGRKLLSGVRSGDTVRAVRGGGGNPIGRYPSRKMGTTLQYETGSIEYLYLVLCENDPAVVEYYHQPSRLLLTYDALTPKGARVRQRRSVSVPDFLVLERGRRPRFVECKDEERMAALAAASNNRFCWSDDGWRSPPGEAACAVYDMDYEVWTPKRLSPQFGSAVERLFNSFAAQLLHVLSGNTDTKLTRERVG